MRPKRRRKGKLRGLAAELPRILSELGMEDAQRALAMGECWEAAVGPDVARHAQPLGLQGNVLEVRVDASVWAQQLQLQRPGILEALARALPEGEKPPEDLRFRVGRAELGSRR